MGIIKMQKNKIYCQVCKFFEEITARGINVCTYKDNIKLKQEDDWHSKRTVEIFRNHPRDINDVNECEWFESKKEKKDHTWKFREI